MKKKPKNKKELWVEAKRKCRLNGNDIRIAKELGLNPRSLIKNIPSKSEPWKLPVKAWILEMYEKRQEKTARDKARKERMRHASSETAAYPAYNTNALVPSRALLLLSVFLHTFRHIPYCLKHVSIR